ncbi:MAG: hypothetical protein QW590_01595 [Candidatus Bilamarchaeaceae archaeon]
MAIGVCSRCGKRGEIEYGSDGLPYCSSCVFYGRMKQCWRCQMYIPLSELQQYKGQWVCPYCLVELREAEKKKEEYKPRKKEELHAPQLRYRKGCERCGRETERLYMWNNRMLCASCLGEEQRKWGLVSGGPMAASYRVTIEKKKSLLQRIIDSILEMLGLKKRERAGEIVAIKKKKKFGKKPKSEGIKKEEVAEPEIEGIVKEAKGPFERYKKE